MITVYELDEKNVFTGNTQEIEEKAGIDKNWSRNAPPSTNQGEYAIFTGKSWFVSTIYPVTPVPVPDVVSMRQARLELLDMGMLDQIEPAIASMESPDKEKAQIEWEYSDKVERSSDLVTQIGAILGLSEEQLDDMFISAAER